MEIFANRGYSAIYPENTLLALQKAVEAGAHGVEMDLRMTQDLQLILMHDRSVDRTTDGIGNVDELLLADIQRLDAGEWKGIAYENEPVPTLESILDTFGTKTKMILHVRPETKDRMDSLMDRLVELIDRFGVLRNVSLLSSEYRTIVMVKNRLPELTCALDSPAGFRGIAARHFLKHSINVDVMHYPVRNVSPALVRNEHSCKRQVRVWVGTDAHDMALMHKAGVDGILTEDPVLGLVYSD